MTQFIPANVARPSSRLLIALAWLIVGLPAAWGVEQTFIKSMALFRAPPQSTVTVSPPATVSTSK